MDKKVDYDQLAPTYDQRFADQRPSEVAQTLQDFVDLHHFNAVLEVGCGTGHWLAHFSQLGPRCFGMDLSRGMLQQAQAHQPDLHLVQGSAPHLAFADNSFDWVYCVNAIHHFDQPERFIEEAYRLLRPGGCLAVIGSNPHGDRERWFGYQYFPGTYKTDLARFPSEPRLAQWFEKASFRGFQRQVVERISKRHVGQQVLSDPYLQKSACSQLALLSETEYAAGLARLERALKQAEKRGTDLEFRTELTIFMWCGQKE
jgi:ubiquinone/menaquinone biosynthesis C-methylase UbiE